MQWRVVRVVASESGNEYRTSSNGSPNGYSKFRFKGGALIRRGALIKFSFQKSVTLF